MFAAPQELRAEVFARLPDALRVRNRSTRWADVQRGGAPTDSFLEGSSFDVSGRLYLVDIPWGRIFTVSPEGEFELFTEYDGEPNGLKIHRDGRIFVADHRRGLMVVDPQSRRVEPYLDKAVQATFKGLNDLHFALNGDLYFTDQGLTGLQDPSGRLYRLRSNGALDPRWESPSIEFARRSDWPRPMSPITTAFSTSPKAKRGPFSGSNFRRPATGCTRTHRQRCGDGNHQFFSKGVS